MSVEIVAGDLLEATEQYICHQCNCLTVHSAGIAHSIFASFPYANIYLERKTKNAKHHLDEIHIRGNGKDQRYVINMMAQYYPGRTKYPNSRKDGVERRHKAFRECLKKIAQIPNIESVAFPWRIGCNLGGGDWYIYENMIRDFAKENSHIQVRIYRKE